MRFRTSRQWIKEELNVEMPMDCIEGKWFIDNNLPMIAKCTCCEAIMILPNALINDEGEIFCQDCAG